MGKDLKGKELGTGLRQRKDGRYEARAKINGIDINLYDVDLILSRLVDTFFSRISPTMQLPPKHHSIAYVLPWAEGLHWQSRSSGCSNS